VPRAAWHAWLGYVMTRMRRPVVVIVTANPQSQLARSLRAVGAQVQTLGVEDPPAAVCDVLLLDADDGPVVAALWLRHAGCARPGGIVAIVDRSQDGLGDLTADGVGRLVLLLEANLLVPNGQQWSRHGDASCIHSYVQSVSMQLARVPAFERGSIGAMPHPLGVCSGFALWSHAGRCYAVPVAGVPFSLRALHANCFEFVLVADRQEQLRQRVEAWNGVRTQLANAVACLQPDPAAATGLVADVLAAQPELPGALLAAVEAVVDRVLTGIGIARRAH
jgi:hypothetical protein